MENEAKRAKRGIIIAFSVLVCILLVIAVIFFMYRSQHTFSQEKWLSNASERYMIVDDMLEKHQLIGMIGNGSQRVLGFQRQQAGDDFVIGIGAPLVSVQRRAPHGRCPPAAPSS